MRTQCSIILLALVIPCGVLYSLPAAQDEKKQPTPRELIREAVRELVKTQEEGGVWPYECTISETQQVGGAIGLRVGNTSIICQALLLAAPEDKEAAAALQRGLTYVLDKLADPDMAAETNKGYNVRVWGQSYALEFLCHVRARKAAGQQTKQVDEWIARLVKTLLAEEIAGGGWNYASQTIPATFVTAPVTQALLLARSQGEKVPDEVLERARSVLERARSEKGAYAYNSPKKKNDGKKDTPESAGRSPACEMTLALLGGSSVEKVRASLNNFHEQWQHLEERRQKPGNHGGKYGIAPYYFFYAHRYAAQAIQMLPQEERAKERERLLKPILQTRGKDGMWNDCRYQRGRSYGTAMVMLALLGDEVPLPPAFVKK